MADTRSKTILLLGDVIYKEAKTSAGAILPGHLIEKITGGVVRKHATAGGNAQAMFAYEDEGQGKTIDDVYAANTIVKYIIPVRGAEVNAILKNGENVVAGDFLESAGGGELQKHVADVDLNHPGSADFTVYTHQIVAVAMEAVNMSGSSAVDPTGRIAVEIL
jgi:hypothetical protein